uniref:hypothetical protein n=1 Tax=Methanobrevibacter smithii TaxID=2173 RepID=UPI0037DC2206
MKGGEIMLSKVIRSLIQKGETEGMREKIDIFYAASRLSDKEYTELVELLKEKEEEKRKG